MGSFKLGGMTFGSLFCSITAVFTNLYIIIPFYMALMGQEMDYFIQMCGEVNPLINNVFTFVVLGILPFNLIKCGVNSFGALVLYKRLSPILHGYGFTAAPAQPKKADV